MDAEMHVEPAHGTLTDAEREIIRSGLDEVNDAADRRYRPRPFAFVVRDAEGTVVGGAEGNAGPHWAYVATLWVHANLRGAGWGARLMASVEDEALRRNCRGVCLTTFTHQAPGFYERLGYAEHGRLPEWPGEHRIYYAKLLGPAGSPGSPRVPRRRRLTLR